MSANRLQGCSHVGSSVWPLLVAGFHCGPLFPLRLHFCSRFVSFLCLFRLISPSLPMNCRFRHASFPLRICVSLRSRVLFPRLPCHIRFMRASFRFASTPFRFGARFVPSFIRPLNRFGRGLELQHGCPYRTVQKRLDVLSPVNPGPRAPSI